MKADLIRLDMNIIEYPLFSRNRKEKKSNSPNTISITTSLSI